ncbi:MAG: oxidoreductase [Alphaproteobacteria bacterium]|nr:oxidoreductase [Alphaproteobacteria bacterium]
MTDTFRALVLDQDDAGKVSASLQTLGNDRLPDADTTVAVKYSSLNYKDGMILNGLGKLVRDYPHIPGVDFVGVVESCVSGAFQPGDDVICTGWRVGEVWWGGFATRARVKSEWLVPLPKGLDSVQAMGLGTAGLTAMLALMALEDHGLTPESEGEVLVTGASGGVGSVAVALLSNLGYRVAAGTGRDSSHDYLTGLGAASLVSRAELEETPRGPLSKARWSGAIDNVGGKILGNLLSSLQPGASCAAVGNAGGFTFEASVLPFLLRGVNLLGIDSVACPTARRVTAWNRLAAELPMDKLGAVAEVHPLSEAPALGKRILEGAVRGRTVIDVNA